MLYGQNAVYCLMSNRIFFLFLGWGWEGWGSESEKRWYRSYLKRSTHPNIYPRFLQYSNCSVIEEASYSISLSSQTKKKKKKKKNNNKITFDYKSQSYIIIFINRQPTGNFMYDCMFTTKIRKRYFGSFSSQRKL